MNSKHKMSNIPCVSKHFSALVSFFALLFLVFHLKNCISYPECRIHKLLLLNFYYCCCHCLYTMHNSSPCSIICVTFITHTLRVLFLLSLVLNPNFESSFSPFSHTLVSYSFDKRFSTSFFSSISQQYCVW